MMRLHNFHHVLRKHAMGVLLAAFLAVSAPLPFAAQSSGPVPLQSVESQAILAALNHKAVEWFQLKKHPQIYVLDFDSYRRQADALNRVAALIELQDVPHDRVLSHVALREILKKRGVPWDSVYVAHDYRLQDLARFFNLAQALNNEEKRLRQDLLQLGLLQYSEKQWRATKQNIAILSIAESASEGTRRWALEHEIRHGRFFTESDYRQACGQFWQALKAEQRQAFRDMLSQNGYDEREEYLMINETQAYLLANLNSLKKRGLAIDPGEIQALHHDLKKRLGELPF